MITGHTLIGLGYKPGKWFGIALEYANKNNLEGDELVQYLEKVCPDPPLELYKSPVKYYKNIKGETEYELSNIKSVYETMDEIMKTPTVVKGAVMPDSCPAGPIGTIPVGGVVVTKNAIHPGMHSADICCSVMLSNLGKINPKLILKNAMKITHFGPVDSKKVYYKSKKGKYVLPNILKDKFINNKLLNKPDILDVANTHLGTQGDGNHFLFVGKSKKTGDVMLITHHGSRGVGAKLYKIGMRIAEKYRKELSPETLKQNAWIPYDTKEGQLYWEALQIIREWTKYNHELIHDEIIKSLYIEKKDRYWNEHNFVFKDQDLFYHAKGATPLDSKFMPDITGPRLIPLNMSEPVLIVSGETTRNNLGFAPHGAGRNISRTQHKKSFGNEENINVLSILDKETKDLDVRFYTGIPDITELPSAYKNADEVRKQMEEFNLGEVIDEVLPYGCIMAGNIPKFNKKNIYKTRRGSAFKKNIYTLDLITGTPGRI